MSKNYSKKIISGVALVALFITACSSGTIFQKSGAGQTQLQPGQKTGLQLWVDNCGTCHNYRAIDSYSDAEWGVAMLHMRVRANLTADDARAITEYLKSAN